MLSVHFPLLTSTEAGPIILFALSTTTFPLSSPILVLPAKRASMVLRSSSVPSLSLSSFLGNIRLRGPVPVVSPSATHLSLQNSCAAVTSMSENLLLFSSPTILEIDVIIPSRFTGNLKLLPADSTFSSTTCLIGASSFSASVGNISRTSSMGNPVVSTSLEAGAPSLAASLGSMSRISQSVNSPPPLLGSRSLASGVIPCTP